MGVAEDQKRGCGNSGLGHLVRAIFRSRALVRLIMALLYLALAVNSGPELPVYEEAGSEID